MSRATTARSIPSDGADSGVTGWPRYRDNLARHLIGLARDLQQRLMNQLVDACGHRDLRPSFGVLITLVAREPRPLSQLARELAISPQAASQLVNLAERAGYLARQSDPRDRRARRPVLTDSGERLVRDAVAYLREIESEYARHVGDVDYRRFSEALATLVQGLDLTPRPNGEDAAAKTGPVRASAGMLPILAAHVEQDLMRATGARGHAGLKLSHGQILTLIGPSGARLHRLAQLHCVSRQAISATAQDLESLGFLRRDADPIDRRGVIVRLTERGTRLIEDSVGALDDLEQAWKKLLDAEAFAALEHVARRIYAVLELEGEILSDAFDGTPVETTGNALRTSAPEDLAKLAARLRVRLGSRDAARLAAHLTAIA